MAAKDEEIAMLKGKLARTSRGMTEQTKQKMKKTKLGEANAKRLQQQLQLGSRFRLCQMRQRLKQPFW